MAIAQHSADLDHRPDRRRQVATGAPRSMSSSAAGDNFAGEFVEVNCATLRGDQAMSALFGHAKGAFTGATAARAGSCKAADGGMLFLDEIGELGFDEQAMLLRAIEEKRFLPVGAGQGSRPATFNSLPARTAIWRPMSRAGRFREDLLARINLWTFCLPGLAQRHEDIEPNLQYELDRFAAKTGRKVTMNKEARDQFLDVCRIADALWTANFRDLNAAVTRMATLSHGGRITVEDVDEEIARLSDAWAGLRSQETLLTPLSEVLSADKIAAIDLFDQAQLAAVLGICRQSPSISEAGRKLFAVSRLVKSQPNDADRLRKYLARFGLSWTDVARQV